MKFKAFFQRFDMYYFSPLFIKDMPMVEVRDLGSVAAAELKKEREGKNE